MIDELVAWGPIEKIRETIQKFVDAGSNHTVIHPLPSGTGDAAPDKVLALLAPAK